MIQQITSNIYEIKVRLAGNPLKDLNSYVILSDDRNLLIDTGFNTEECLSDLITGIGELGLDMNRTDLFITHLHADHSGLVSKVASPTSRVYMNKVDKEILAYSFANRAEYWNQYITRFLREGYPAEALTWAAENNAAKRYAESDLFDFIPVTDGFEIQVGDLLLECVDTPGHTPGHTCLYNKEHGIIFLGDHVLFDITPNISIWPGTENPLALYLASLDKIRDYDVRLPLPAHRNSGIFMQQRIDELKEHHATRLNEVVAIVKDTPGINGYTVAERMKWSIRAKNWEDFPAPQKWFAVGEALAHLEYLLANGTLTQAEKGGYFCS